MLILLLTFVTSSCKKDKESDSKTKAALLIALAELEKRKIITAEENPCSALASSTVYTKETSVTITMSSGSCYYIVKQATTIIQQKQVKSTDSRQMNIPLVTEGSYLLQIYKRDDKKEPVSELIIIRKNTANSPSIAPSIAARNNLTGEYNTTSATETFNVIPTEKMQSLFCNNKEYADSSLKEGNPSSFTISVGIKLTLSCVVTDLAGNQKTIDDIIIKKVTESAWLEHSLPTSFSISDIEVVKSCYQSNLSELTVTAGTAPVLVTINENGQACVSLYVPFGSGTTIVSIEGKNILGNSYSVTHYVTQLRGIRQPIITLTGETKIKVEKNDSLEEITTFVFIGNEFITSFTENEKVIDLATIAPVGTNVISAKSTRRGQNSVISTCNLFRKFIAQTSDVESQKIDNHPGNYSPTQFEFLTSGTTAKTTYGMTPSRPFVRATFTSPTGFADNVQLTLRARSLTEWNTRRQSNALVGVFNTTYVIKVRVYNFTKKSYDEAVTVQGSEQIPITLSLTRDNISNKQIVVLLEGGENTKAATGNYYYTLRQFNRCSPAWGGSNFSCPYGDFKTYSDQSGMFCGTLDATCYELQWIETSSTVNLPINEIGFAVFE